MHRLLRVLAMVTAGVVLLSPAGGGGVLRAQDAGAQLAEGANRGPRFFYASLSGGVPRRDARNAAVLKRRVSLQMTGMPLARVLDEIARQTGLNFTYSRDVIPVDARVSVRAEEFTVAAVLTELLIDTPLDVVLSPNGNVGFVRRVREAEQGGTVVGRVTDGKTGDWLVGAEVFLEGTRWRVSTGADGRYRIVEVAPGSYALAVRRVGYTKQSRPVTVVADREVTVDVALLPAATQLNEIVTTVTGEQRRVELGHVVGRINADSLVKEAPVSSLSELLSSRVPGMRIDQAQGTVGGKVRLQVRGPNSINVANQPIVIVDGVRYTSDERKTLNCCLGPNFVEPTSSLNDLNINDIESVEVVKGPSAATLYGTDAANGVLVITTKRGRSGPARWSMYGRASTASVPQRNYPNLYWGWGTVNGVPSNPLLSCTLARLASGQCTQQDSITVLSNPLSDPELSIFTSRPRWEYGMNVGGGQRALRYYLSADFEDATGPIRMPPGLAEKLRQAKGLAVVPEEWVKPNAFTKLNLRTNMTAGFGEAAEVTITTGYIRNATRALQANASPYLNAHFRGVPGIESPYSSASIRFNDPTEAFTQSSDERTDRFVTSAAGHWRPSGWLTTRATLGLDLLGSYRYSLAPPGYQLLAGGRVVDERSRQAAVSADLGLTATARHGRVSTRTSAGTQYVRNLYNASQSIGDGLPPGGSVIQDALTVSTRQGYTETVVLGGFVEEMLGLNERFFLTGALRMDGASTFGRDFDAAFYPKIGASWLLTEEPFMPRVPGLDELRLRYAFGASGKQPHAADARPMFTIAQVTLNGVRVNTLALTGLGNPDLRPERVQEHEFGFDVTGLASRLTLDVTWFRRTTKDQLVFDEGPTGRGSIMQNLGLTTQRGFEAQVSARILETRMLSWELALQHALYRTKLVDVANAAELRAENGGYVEGYPLGARFRRPVVSWADQNGDGIILGSEIQYGTEWVYAGENTPPQSQSLTTVVGLFNRRLRLSALLDRRSGFTQRNEVYCRQQLTCREVVDRTAPLEQQVKARTSPQLEKGDFTRLREVAATFDLPIALTRTVGFHRGTLVVSARNLALWSDFSGPDPEASDPATGGLGGGWDTLTLGQALGIPQSRVFSVRLDLGF